MGSYKLEGGKAGRKAEAAKKRLARQAGGRGEIAGRSNGREKRRSLAAVSDGDKDVTKDKRQGRDGK